MKICVTVDFLFGMVNCVIYR